MTEKTYKLSTVLKYIEREYEEVLTDAMMMEIEETLNEMEKKQ